MTSEQIKEYGIDDFRKEMVDIAEDPGNEADFPEGIDAVELTEGDMAIWRKIRDKTVEMPDVAEYLKNFEKENGFESKSRYNFFMFMATRANVIVGLRETMQK